MVTYALGVVIREPQIFKERLSVDDVASDDFRALPKMKLLLVIWGASRGIVDLSFEPPVDKYS